MRCKGLSAISHALADQYRTHEARDTRIDVHHCTASEVECALLEQPPGRGCRCIGSRLTCIGIRTGPEPHHVRNRQIGEGEPQDREEQHCGELHTFCETADDQRNSNGCEGRLEGHECKFGEHHTFGKGCCISNRTCRRIENPLEEKAIETTDKGVTLRKCKRITV